jgi:mannose-1-phosphate guanylyltransferase
LLEQEVCYYELVIVVIIAGGSGSRLWPLSTPGRPKHLLQLNGSKRSLLQGTFSRAEKLVKDINDIYVVTDASHYDLVKEQLPKLPDEAFIVEPSRRGTANCVAAALAALHEKYDHDEPIVFMHSDHYIRDTKGFVHSFKLAAKVTKEQKNIVLIGIEPGRPSTAFGYIEKGELIDEERFVFRVANFHEKPNFKVAQEYFQSGNYLWNSGYFVGSLTTFTESMRLYAPNLLSNYEQLAKVVGTKKFASVYAAFESDAIDYALIETVENLLVLPATFDWMDLGSYKDLARALGGNELGNHVHGEKVELEEVKNSFIQNYEDKPVAVIGIDNCVVINTPQGLLVTTKDYVQKVGDVSKRFRDK